MTEEERQAEFEAGMAWVIESTPFQKVLLLKQASPHTVQGWAVAAWITLKPLTRREVGWLDIPSQPAFQSFFEGVKVALKMTQ